MTEPMKTEEIKWILYHDRNTDPVSRSCNDRLRRFGFCFVLDEYGSDISRTAQLAILDTMLQKELPNILMICPQNLMFNRYGEMITGCGADFKLLTSSEGTIEYFAENSSNMYIASEKALTGGSEVLKLACGKLVWDLVIIDATLSVNGIDEKLYTRNLRIKTNKLLIFAPFPAGRNGDGGALNRTAAAMLNDENAANLALNTKIDKDCIAFEHDAPVTRNFEPEVYRGDTARPVKVLHYAFDKSYLNGLRRQTDLKTGQPLYPYGGNIFEEYATEITRLYVKPVYTVRDVNELRATDKKLDRFLESLDEMIRGSDGRAIVYCVTQATANYLSKVVYALYPKSTGILRVERGGIFNTENISASFERRSKTYKDRIFITVDDAGHSASSSAGYTHIFNYELPDDPMMLEVRASRHARSGGKEFILFADDNGMFDSRMLSKVIFGRIYDSLIPGVPGRNVLFDIPQAAEYTAGCIYELMSIVAFADRFTGNDVILKFKGDFNVPDTLVPNSAPKVLEFVKLKLARLLRALSIDNAMSECGRDLNKLTEKLRPVFERLKNSLLYIDEDHRIQAVDKGFLAGCFDPEKGREYITSLAGSEADVGLKAARKALTDYNGEERDAQLRDCVNQLPDVLKMPVLLNAWKYLSDEYIIQDSFKEFMKKFNEGVM